MDDDDLALTLKEMTAFDARLFVGYDPAPARDREEIPFLGITNAIRTIIKAFLRHGISEAQTSRAALPILKPVRCPVAPVRSAIFSPRLWRRDRERENLRIVRQ